MEIKMNSMKKLESVFRQSLEFSESFGGYSTKEDVCVICDSISDWLLMFKVNYKTSLIFSCDDPEKHFLGFGFVKGRKIMKYYINAFESRTPEIYNVEELNKVFAYTGKYFCSKIEAYFDAYPEAYPIVRKVEKSNSPRRMNQRCITQEMLKNRIKKSNRK